MAVLDATLFLRNTPPPHGGFPTEAEASDALRRYKMLTLTSMYIQVVIDTFLCAVFTVMLYTYWRFQPNDQAWTRALVIAASVMGYLVTCYLIWFVQHFFVQNFGSYRTFFETGYFSWFPVLDAITTSLAQGYTTHRVWQLNGRNWVLLGVINALLLASFAGAIWTKVQLDRFDSLIEALRTRRTPMTLWLAAVMGANILITGAVVPGLVRTRSTWSHNENHFSRLVRLILESQLPATLLSIAFLIQIRVAPTSLLASTFQSIQSKLYLISLLYSLNGRVTYWAGDVHGDTSDEKTDPSLPIQLEPIPGLRSQPQSASTPCAPPHAHTYPPRLRGSKSLDLDDDIPLQTLGTPMGVGGRKWSDPARESRFAGVDVEGADGAEDVREGGEDKSEGKNEGEDMSVGSVESDRVR